MWNSQNKSKIWVFFDQFFPQKCQRCGILCDFQGSFAYTFPWNRSYMYLSSLNYGGFKKNLIEKCNCFQGQICIGINLKQNRDL